MSIITTIRNQTKAQARRVEWRTNEYTRLNTRSNTFGYSWKLNECLLIGRANNTHKIETQNSSYEIRKAKKKKSQSAINYSYLRLFIYLSFFSFSCFFFFFLLVVVATEKKCYEFKEMKTLSSSCSGNCQARTGFQSKQRQKTEKKIQKKNIYKKVSTLLIKWKVFASHVILFCGLCMSGRGVWGGEGIFAWRNTYPMHSGHNADSYRPRGRSPC